MVLKQPVEGLYVHVPFCARGKCRYCDFYSIPASSEHEARYLVALRREIKLTAPGVFPHSIFIGGGTPTSLSMEGLDALLSLVDLFPRDLVKEYTVEANPGTLDSARLRLFSSRGVNRLSVGVQSFDDSRLAFLGRRHSGNESKEAVAAVLQAGIANVSVDLISDIPGTSDQGWLQELDTAISLGVKHISCYSLTLEPGTPLFESARLGEFQPEPPELSAHRMLLTGEYLNSRGFRRYEISNFAIPGFECRHNRLYWRNGSYLGLGPSSASFIDGERRRNVADLKEYSVALEAGRLPVEMRERLSARKFAGETAMLMLRRHEGVVATEFLTVTGVDAFSLFEKQIKHLTAIGMLELTRTGVRIPESQIALSDSVMTEFLEDD
ncbi:MAG: radical SAM family heme chaperone HemW [Candidatus Brocadiia bacterium]